jgi:hypothetical protein
MNPFPASQLIPLEPHMAFFQREESVILPHANIVSRMEAGSSLAYDDVSWFYFLKKKKTSVSVGEQYDIFFFPFFLY